jgi:hypothetical protein
MAHKIRNNAQVTAAQANIYVDASAHTSHNWMLSAQTSIIWMLAPKPANKLAKKPLQREI